MLQHLALALVVPPLILLGAPLLLLLAVPPPHLGRKFARMLRLPVFKTLASPVLSWFLFACVLWGIHFSAVYNLASPGRRPLLRRLDHAAIFLMIAGSYTPFTTQRLHGAWAWGMTAAVWTIAAFGALGQVFLPRLDRRLWVAVYLALGWLVVVALKPILQGTTAVALLLLVLGGVLYSAGVIFYLNKRLKFGRAIWHGHVVAAAGAHWAAVLVGVVLATPN